MGKNIYNMTQLSLSQINLKRFRYPVLVLIVIGIGLLHFFTPGHLVFYHDTFRRLSYFPIALGGIWFGIRGGLSLAAITSVAFIPHLLLFVGKGLGTYLSELTEIILYLAVGLVIGAIAGRESKLREKYRLLSEKLKKSYQRLQKETELLLDVEEQLRLSQKISILGQLSSSLAHEIKNPLGSIKGTAEILLDDYPEGHPKREFVEILMTETSRLDASVNEVLLLFKGKAANRPEAVMERLSDVLTRVLKLFSREFEKKNINITMQGLEFAEKLMVPGETTSQIFINLVLNAIDAMGYVAQSSLKETSVEGGDIEDVGIVKTGIKGAGLLGIKVLPGENGVHVQVSDNGPGVPVDSREKIFDPFYSSKEDGTGLGLSISLKIAESYNGDIKLLETEPGACFDVFLPDMSGQ